MITYPYILMGRYARHDTGGTSEHCLKTIPGTIIVAAALLLCACQVPPRHAGGSSADGDPSATAENDDTAEMEIVFSRRELVVTCPEPAPREIEPLSCPEMPDKTCPPCPVADTLDDKMLLGGVEEVRLDPPGMVYQARIDSGAAGTSVHATNIVRFERDGDSWVRFEVDNPDGEPLSLERPVVRRVRIRRAELDEVEKRIVVMLNLTLGSLKEQVEFSLTDRSEMEYSVLIGRNVLRNNAVVDVSREFIAPSR